MGPAEIEAFLTHLAVAGNVARSTQNQALNALLFLYREVLGIALDDAAINAMRAHKKGTLPVVLTKDEVQRVILATPGVYQLIAKLLYGSGLRLIEGSPPPNWVLRTAFGPASLAGLSAVRSTRAQHLEQPWEADAERQQQAEAQMELGCATEYLVEHGPLRAVPDQT